MRHPSRGSREPYDDAHLGRRSSRLATRSSRCVEAQDLELGSPPVQEHEQLAAERSSISFVRTVPRGRRTTCAVGRTAYTRSDWLLQSASASRRQRPSPSSSSRSRRATDSRSGRDPAMSMTMTATRRLPTAASVLKARRAHRPRTERGLAEPLRACSSISCRHSLGLRRTWRRVSRHRAVLSVKDHGHAMPRSGRAEERCEMDGYWCG